MTKKTLFITFISFFIITFICFNFSLQINRSPNGYKVSVAKDSNTYIHPVRLYLNNGKYQLKGTLSYYLNDDWYKEGSGKFGRNKIETVILNTLESNWVLSDKTDKHGLMEIQRDFEGYGIIFTLAGDVIEKE